MSPSGALRAVIDLNKDELRTSLVLRPSFISRQQRTFMPRNHKAPYMHKSTQVRTGARKPSATLCNNKEKTHKSWALWQCGRPILYCLFQAGLWLHAFVHR